MDNMKKEIKQELEQELEALKTLMPKEFNMEESCDALEKQFLKTKNLVIYSDMLPTEKVEDIKKIDILIEIVGEFREENKEEV